MIASKAGHDMDCYRVRYRNGTKRSFWAPTPQGAADRSYAWCCAYHPNDSGYDRVDEPELLELHDITAEALRAGRRI